MVDIVLFGVPEGFSILPGFEQEETFFQTFYRSLSGKENDELLDIRNRKDKIVYSYLRYNFKDKNGRANSFFGYSLVFRERVYKDFVSLFDLMKRVYDEKIRNSTILTDNGGEKSFKIKNFGELNQGILSNIKTAIESGLSQQNLVEKFSSDTQNKQVLISNIAGLESEEDLNKRLYFYVKKYANIYLQGQVLENVINKKQVFVPSSKKIKTVIFVNEYLSEGELESLTQRLVSSCKDIESFYRDQSKIGSTEKYSTVDKPTLQYYQSSIEDLLKKINTVETEIRGIIPKLQFYSRAAAIETLRERLDKLKEYYKDLENKEILISSKITLTPPIPTPPKPDDNFFEKNKKTILGIIGAFIIIIVVLVIKPGKNTTKGGTETITALVEEDNVNENTSTSRAEESISKISPTKKEEKVEVKGKIKQKTEGKKPQKKEENKKPTGISLQAGDLDIRFDNNIAKVSISAKGRDKGIKEEEVKKGHWVVNGENKGGDLSLDCSEIRPNDKGNLEIRYVSKDRETIASTKVKKPRGRN
ncbi:MAG: hypothetical protein SPK94_06795 [Bacteroidales bacterium]|nr:hypothetical protein [Bacteroidales bacterium]